MKNHFQLLVISMLFLYASLPLQAQTDGENLFKATCATCHTIGKGRLVGPDLKGVNDLREQDWLIRFIRSSQKLIKENDPVAVEIFKEYNKIPMPDHNFTNNEILSILDYIQKTSSGNQQATAAADTKTETTDTTETAMAVTVTPELLNKGEALFYGYENFSNGAPSCIACHSIQDESVIGGGTLSFDLTGSFGRLGQAGINAILTNPPFPAMNVALNNKNLTDDEKQAITAMLQYVNVHYAGNRGSSMNEAIFLMFSLLFAMFLLVTIYILYDNRKIPKH